MLPTEFGATGWLGEDGTVEEAGRALQKRFGIGCYSEDADSRHGLLCTAMATAFGIASADDWAILTNAYPDTAIDLLTEWEVQLGLSPAPVGMTTEARWNRLSYRCTEAKGNNPAVLAVVFGMICGATCYVSETDSTVHADHDRFEVAVILPLAVWGTATWTECERVRDRIQPAHCRINLCVTHDSGSPHRHPVFRTDESLTDRDCCRPHG
jgi:hypothetical protein